MDSFIDNPGGILIRPCNKVVSLEVPVTARVRVVLLFVLLLVITNAVSFVKVSITKTFCLLFSHPSANTNRVKKIIVLNNYSFE